LSFITGNNASHHWNRFVQEVTNLDRIRKENFWDTFPEFRGLK